MSIIVNAINAPKNPTYVTKMYEKICEEHTQQYITGFSI